MEEVREIIGLMVIIKVAFSKNLIGYVEGEKC
jgi:hypothetical protein